MGVTEGTDGIAETRGGFCHRLADSVTVTGTAEAGGGVKREYNEHRAPYVSRRIYAKWFGDDRSNYR